MKRVETCAICGGSGWKIIEREGISGRRTMRVCERGREQRLETRANIPPLYRNPSVDNFIFLQQSNCVRRLASVVLTVLGRCTRISQRASRSFHRTRGTGKTHLAVAALRGTIGRRIRRRILRLPGAAESRPQRLRIGASGTMDRNAYGSALRVGRRGARRPGRASA